jgi:drug/metabolite transporter (DMT)-like permease
MFQFLALTSAVLYGAADFLGGLTSRRVSTVTVVALSQGSGLLVLAISLPLLPVASPLRSDWLWGAAAGLAGGVGVGLLYRALAVGTMAVAAPVTAVTAVAIPVLVALVLGERPGAQVGVGILMAVAAIVLVSQQDIARDDGVQASRQSSGLDLALAAGVAIGLFFLSLARTSTDAGLWPMLVARSVSFTLFAVMAILRRQSLRMPSATAAIVVCGGVLDMAANVLYLLAARLGPLSVAVTLSSLYPASTVVLARAMLGERLNRRQATGIVFALVAVVLIVSGSP